MPLSEALGDRPTPLALTDQAFAVASPVLAREIASLQHDELIVAWAAGVLGEEFDSSDLAAMTDRDPERVANALDALVARDLLRTDPAGGRLFRFRHPVLRALVYQGTPPGWRQRAHARAERLLRERDAPAMERVSHVACSAQAGDFEAIRLLQEAADRLLDTDPTTAMTWLSTALRLLREDCDPELRMQLKISLARSLCVSGQLDACRELLEEVLRQQPEAEPTQRGLELVAFQAMVERHLGDYRHAQARLETEIAMLPDHATTLGDPLRLELATVSLLRRAFDRSRHLAQETLQRAVAAQNRHLRMAATVRLAHCSAFAGDVPALLHWAKDASSQVDSMTDVELASDLDTLCQLGWAEPLAERHHDALRHTARGIRLAQASGQLFVLPYMRLAHAYSSVNVGRLTDALRSAEKAEEDAHQLGRPALLGFALALRAWAVSLVESPDAAAPIAEQAVQEIGAGGRLWPITAGVLASIRLAQNRPIESLDLIQSAIDHSRHPGTARCIQPLWYALAAKAAAASENNRAAAEWAARAAKDAERLGLPGQRGHAALARSYTKADPVGPLQEAICEFATSGLVLMECQARLLLARLLVSRGLHGDVTPLVNRAKSLSEASGARHLYRQAVDIQRQLGARLPRKVREPKTTPLPEMSVREMEIARMVALGMSNNDIARALVVSPKTVEAHLTRIFRKAGVRSRVALVAALSNAESPSP
ncbi:LuxR C-terminal-related transcriptional regulator [Streptomyces chartreusis]|uniref:helix-turn-helix transcriptional regulator n=1 Tax=Streptomyces chartreusis TaxID=1969 RepID=UPI003D90D9E2